MRPQQTVEVGQRWLYKLAGKESRSTLVPYTVLRKGRRPGLWTLQREGRRSCETFHQDHLFACYRLVDDGSS
jgi:hypothetical protein